MNDTVEAPRAQGLEAYDWYHYLWHLIAIGAVKAASFDGSPTDAAAARYRLQGDAWCTLETAADRLPGHGEIVAMIDTGVNDRHPNLETRVLPAVDFGANPFGVTHRPVVESHQGITVASAIGAATPMTRGLEAQNRYSLVDDHTWNWIKDNFPSGSRERAILERLQAGRGIELAVTDVSRQRYSAHGTACAGLIMGAPATDDDDDASIPYWGVAPGAQLLPITVTARPTPEQLILAFLYARSFRDEEGRGVSVIHFPREAPDPWRAPRHKRGYDDATRYSAAESRLAWDLLNRVIEEVSREIPVVCAAGNDGLDRIIYPASLSHDADNGVIAVGSVSYNAKRSAYSNYADIEQSLTIVAPSDDAEVYTRHQVRLDKEAPSWRDHNNLVHLAGGLAQEVVFSPQAVLSPDIPGPRGYAEGFFGGAQSDDQLDDDRASLYALFGGTSAASAIVAGAAALCQAKSRAAGGEPLDGAEMKKRVSGAGVTNVSWPWLGASTTLATDKPNGETSMASERQFGPGVLDLFLLLKD